MKHTEICECCWNKISTYTHALNKSLISAFGQLVYYYRMNWKLANLQKNLSLSKNQYNNFQKLQYWGIVSRNKGGRYPTRLWFDFFDCKTNIFDRVATFWKKVLSPTNPLREKDKKKPKLIYIYDIDQIYFKRREEYQSEKTKTLFD